MTPLAVKIIRNDNNLQSLANEKDYPNIKVLARCLELLEDERNRLAVVTFLRSAAPLLGQQPQLKPQWDCKLAELSKFLEYQSSTTAKSMPEMERTLIWEEKIVEFLEESVRLEGNAWALKLADELVAKPMTPSLSIFIAAISSSVSHVSLLIELARTHSVNTTGHGYVLFFSN